MKFYRNLMEKRMSKNNTDTKKLISNWPEWMQNYRLTSNSPNKKTITKRLLNEKKLVTS